MWINAAAIPVKYNLIVSYHVYKDRENLTSIFKSML